MSTNPPSLRFPFAISEKTEPAVADALRTTYNGLLVHEQAFAQLNAKVDALAPSTPTSGTSTTNENITTETVVQAGVSSFNTLAGAVTYFPSMGAVNNQSGATAYTTQTQDNGALIVLADSSAVAVTLNYAVTPPWYTTISNQGAGTVTVTPQQGTINGAASATIAPNAFATIFFDGANWWSDSPATGGTGGGVTSLNGETGAITLAAGTGISVTPSGSTITIAATGGGGGYSLGGALTSANIAFGPGAGTGASISSVSGLDGNHQIGFTTGSSPVAHDIIYTVTFTASRGHVTYPVYSAAGNFGFSISQIPAIGSTSSATQYQLASGATPLAAGILYLFNISAP